MKAVARMGDSFEAKELNGEKWIGGHSNVTDALKKWKLELVEILSEVMKTGI